MSRWLHLYPPSSTYLPRVRKKKMKKPGIGLSRPRAHAIVGVGDTQLDRELDAMAEGMLREERMCDACGHPGAAHKRRVGCVHFGLSGFCTCRKKVGRPAKLRRIRKVRT